MPQVSLYIDKPTLDQVTVQARESQMSVSKMVSSILAKSLGDDWPASLVDAYGSVTDASFNAPTEIDQVLDTRRDAL